MQRHPNSTPRRLEVPTLILAAVIYGAWIVITALHAALPSALLALLGGIVTAWHGSLQHETIHGHPTRNPWINAAIGAVPLSLWLPYAIYRRTHIAHHVTPNITDPFDDPESQYLAAGRGLNPWLARLEAPLLGRLILGPPIRIVRFLLQELLRAFHQPRAALGDWGPHLLGVAALLCWLHHVEFSIGRYLLTFVYPGTALSLLRSYAEHRADEDRTARAAIIPAAGPFGLLFLNNNLHAVHHARPDIAWYALPAYYRRHRDAFRGGPCYPSYAAIVRRFLLTPHDGILHPDHGGRQPTA